MITGKTLIQVKLSQVHMQSMWQDWNKISCCDDADVTCEMWLSASERLVAKHGSSGSSGLLRILSQVLFRGSSWCLHVFTEHKLSCCFMSHELTLVMTLWQSKVSAWGDNLMRRPLMEMWWKTVQCNGALNLWWRTETSWQPLEPPAALE